MSDLTPAPGGSDTTDQPGHATSAACVDGPEQPIPGGHDLITAQTADLVEVATATFDKSGVYRYELTRCWGAGRTVTFVMLNPSTATHLELDPTIARCRRRAIDNGYGRLRVLNLHALRATDPDQLTLHPSPVGPANEAVLRHRLAEPDQDVVIAWGSHRAAADQAIRVVDLLHELRIQPLCLGQTASGQPRHPLYVAGVQPLVPFRLEATGANGSAPSTLELTHTDHGTPPTHSAGGRA